MQVLLKFLFGLLSLLLCIDARTLAPLMDAKDKDFVIPDHYIIVLRNTHIDSGMNSVNAAQHEMWVNSLIATAGSGDDSMIGHSFSIDGLVGYTGKFSEGLIEKIRTRDEVAFVEPDQIVYAYDGIIFDDTEDLYSRRQRDFVAMMLGITGFEKKMGSTKFDFEGRIEKIKKKLSKKRPVEKDLETQNKIKQMDAPWGLSRLSQRERPSIFGEYLYPKSAGSGIDVYIVDTGINITHEEFEGRAIWGKTIPLFDEDIDGNGHGTHVAGTIGGKTYGVAKQANLIAVKVLRTNGFGTNSDVIKGIEWVTKTHKRKSRIDKSRKSVANMSLGGGRSISLERAVNRAVAAGVHFAVAAGNDNEDACNYSPAAATGPVTVGASTRLDDMAFFSNHGTCVDIFAPGLDIKSAWIGSDTAVNTISGTSMASPHVAGVMALYLGERNYQPEELKELLIEHSTKDILGDLPPSTENRLLAIEPLLEMLQ